MQQLLKLQNLDDLSRIIRIDIRYQYYNST